MRIAGAGLAGLLAAHAWPNAELFDPQSGPRADHRALLRFRTDAVARMIGVEFQPVTVHKGIWIDGGFVPPSIQMANYYSKKILGSLEADRSIWNIEAAQRFIAPENLYEQMVETVGRRIHWGSPCEFVGGADPIISTAPMPVLLELLGIKTDAEFKRSPIHVLRYRVPRCAVYQTIYFPQPEQPVYRASITRDLLIVESAHNVPDLLQINNVMEAFGIYDLVPIDAVEQKFGKIAPLETSARRALLSVLTQRGIYSLGRFATWRNILLDDVVNDIAVIRKLLRMSEYEQRLHLSN
jgi:hypothetical protein